MKKTLWIFTILALLVATIIQPTEIAQAKSKLTWTKKPTIVYAGKTYNLSVKGKNASKMTWSVEGNKYLKLKNKKGAKNKLTVSDKAKNGTAVIIGICGKQHISAVIKVKATTIKNENIVDAAKLAVNLMNKHEDGKKPTDTDYLVLPEFLREDMKNSISDTSEKDPITMHYILADAPAIEYGYFDTKELDKETLQKRVKDYYNSDFKIEEVANVPVTYQYVKNGKVVYENVSAIGMILNNGKWYYIGFGGCHVSKDDFR